MGTNRNVYKLERPKIGMAKTLHTNDVTREGFIHHIVMITICDSRLEYITIFVGTLACEPTSATEIEFYFLWQMWTMPRIALNSKSGSATAQSLNHVIEYMAGQWSIHVVSCCIFCAVTTNQTRLCKKNGHILWPSIKLTISKFTSCIHGWRSYIIQQEDLQFHQYNCFVAQSFICFCCLQGLSHSESCIFLTL